MRVLSNPQSVGDWQPCYSDIARVVVSVRDLHALGIEKFRIKSKVLSRILQVEYLGSVSRVTKRLHFSSYTCRDQS